MARNLYSTRISFITNQLIALLLAIGLTILIVGIAYVQTTLANEHNILDKKIAELEEQLMNKDELPSFNIYTEGYFSFIISAKDGTYILERNTWMDQNPALWESHHSKLIYAMQKQKRGWLTYPARESWQINKPQNIIRYQPIESLGWIIGIEKALPSELDLFKSIFNPMLFMELGVVLVIFALWVVYLINKTYGSLTKLVTETLENNYININNENNWNEPPTQTKEPEKISIQQAFNEPSIPIITKPDLPKISEPELPPITDPENSLNSQQHEQSKITSPIEPEISPHIKQPLHNFLEPEEVIISPTFEPKPIEKSLKKTKQILKPKIEEPSPLDEMVIDEHDIKSPILRKMISELRGKK